MESPRTLLVLASLWSCLLMFVMIVKPCVERGLHNVDGSTTLLPHVSLGHGCKHTTTVHYDERASPLLQARWIAPTIGVGEFDSHVRTKRHKEMQKHALANSCIASMGKV